MRSRRSTDSRRTLEGPHVGAWERSHFLDRTSPSYRSRDGRTGRVRADSPLGMEPPRRRPRAAVGSPGVRPALRDLAIVLGASWIARALFVAVIGDAHAVDADHWVGALEAIERGDNPYSTGVLNWPPLWLVVIAGLDVVVNQLDVTFLSVLRVYLVVAESALVVTLYLLLIRVGAARTRVFRALLVGIALNPIAIFLTCQHGNSDVQVGLLVTLAVAALVAHGRSRDVVYWLIACLMLGLGVLAKTVPLALAPILASGARRTSRSGKYLGFVLFLGPAALGMAVLLALAPSPVVDHVLLYRSTRGFFGLGGLLDEDVLGLLGDARQPHGRVFTVLTVIAVLWLWRRLRREPPPTADRLFLLVATILMTVVVLGPGYGPQYAYWFLPALVATYVLLDGAWRRLLIVCYVVAAVTYTVEYAFVPWLGAGATAALGRSDWLTEAGTYLDEPLHLTLFRLPLLAAYLALTVAGIRRLASPDRYDAKLSR